MWTTADIPVLIGVVVSGLWVGVMVVYIIAGVRVLQ